MKSTPPSRPHRIYLFEPPYRLPRPLASPSHLTNEHSRSGAAVIWCMGSVQDEEILQGLRRRPGGIPLLGILPRAREIDELPELLRLVELCRTHALLPFHQEPDPIDLRTLIAEPPEDLPGAVIDYLTWRGIILDLDTRRLIRRTLELSNQIRTVGALARGVYMSRRALGRKFLREGLPVPSHWLHLGRVLTVVLHIQGGRETLMAAASRFGYPDGFSLSNQMKRLTGVRPTEVKQRLGWEWVFEAWIQTEIENGGFSDEQVELLETRSLSAPANWEEGAESA